MVFENSIEDLWWGSVDDLGLAKNKEGVIMRASVGHLHVQQKSSGLVS